MTGFNRLRGSCALTSASRMVSSSLSLGIAGFGHGSKSKSYPPVNIRFNPTTKIGFLTWVVNSPTNQNGINHNSFDHHSQIRMRGFAIDFHPVGLSAAIAFLYFKPKASTNKGLTNGPKGDVEQPRRMFGCCLLHMCHLFCFGPCLHRMLENTATELSQNAGKT